MLEICDLFWDWSEGGKETVIVGGKPLNAVVKQLANPLPTVAWKADNVFN